MAATQWAKGDTERALKAWDEYQKSHDVSDQIGQAVGIDPESGRIWFGESALEIVDQLEAEGLQKPLYFLRVGRDYYQRKGGHR